MLSAKIPNELRKTIYRREHFACALCDDVRHLQIHHVVKRSLGGTNSEHNLICLCSRCHALVHGVDLYDGAVDLSPAEAEQACVEYLADFYAPDWNPWKRE